MTQGLACIGERRISCWAARCFNRDPGVWLTVPVGFLQAEVEQVRLKLQFLCEGEAHTDVYAALLLCDSAVRDV
jgi:hypothetical protein